MKLVCFSLVLDGMPFITRHLSILEQTKLEWRWIVVEGSAQNTASTSWCKPQKPRLSTDGTHEFLKSITDPRVTCIHSPDWKSKDQMTNAALEQITEDCVLLECDSDEIWRADQLTKIIQLFEDRQSLSSIMFGCRYFVGPDLVLQGQNCYGDYDYEWLRAWRFTPGQRFISHEPPVLEGDDPARRMSKDESRKLGLVFDHFAYATEAQVAYKQSFYPYPGLLNGWRALQAHKNFPVSLSRFFPHVSGDEPKVVRLSA